MRHDENKKTGRIKSAVILRFCPKVLLIWISFTICLTAQWIGSSEKNTLLANNCFNPINISSVDDGIGGLFIFWEDNRSGFQSDINFIHVNGDGIVSFRTDGKKVSSSGSPGNNPLCTAAPPNSAYIVWKERGFGIAENLKAQRVSSAGNLLWNQNGLIVNEGTKQVGDFSASSDNSGRLYVTYIPKNTDNLEDYIIKLQALNHDGNILFPKGITAARSKNKKSNVISVPDKNENINIFWLENISGKTVLMGQSIDAAGKFRWGSKSIIISDPLKNVFSYSVKTFNSLVYIVWQTQQSDKDIFHQLISSDGKFLWPKHGKQVASHKGNQSNPQPLISGNTILLTWTDDNSGDRNIHIQKYDSHGMNLWDKHGMPVINMKGDQFGQKILSDGKDGAIVTWIDRRSASIHGNIFAQRISKSGKPLWDSLGVSVASSNNTEKSYVNVIPDVTGGAIVVFKEKRNGRNEIFGHKIFNTGTFTSQIVAFNSELKGDSVKISWYSANEAGRGSFRIERTAQSDSASDTWQNIKEVFYDGKAAARYYEYYDRPDKLGTIYYRVVHSDNMGNIQPSDLAKIHYLDERAGIFVSQNSPNPFKNKTVINIYLPETEKIKIEFFDSHIEKIKETEQMLSAGMNEIEFSADGLAPGIYFYKVHASDFIDVKKMVITN